MRTLDCEEQVFVAGGFGSFSCPPCPEDCPITDEVTIPGKRNPSNSDPRFGATNLTIISGSINIMMFRDAWDAAVNAEELLRTESGRPAAIDGSEGLGDTIKGFPVDHHSRKDSIDYGPEWETVLKKLSVLERNAFASALESYASGAKSIGEDGVEEFLEQLAHAVLSNAPGWAGDASSRATQNLTQRELGMFEVFVTAAYASAAALPGGI
jgi:hypothetical protein